MFDSRINTVEPSESLFITGEHDRVLAGFFDTDSIASTTFFFALASESNSSNPESATAASFVPDHVRKSFAVKSSPETSRR